MITMGPGPGDTGKYDDVCESVLRSVSADAVILLVVNGHIGNGYSAMSTSEAISRKFPELLRAIADDIDNKL